MLRILLLIGAVFFFFEALIHGLGLPVLQHDEIFLPTHDRYIAIFALTYSALFLLIAWDVKKYRELFVLTMAGVFLGILNAVLIASTGGYTASFGTTKLDADLNLLGVGVVIWYAMTWVVFLRTLKKPVTNVERASSPRAPIES